MFGSRPSLTHGIWGLFPHAGTDSGCCLGAPEQGVKSPAGLELGSGQARSEISGSENSLRLREVVVRYISFSGSVTVAVEGRKCYLFTLLPPPTTVRGSEPVSFPVVSVLS